MTIDEILVEAYEAAKESNVIIMKNGDKNRKDNYGLHDLYSETCKMFRSIRNHAVKGVFPEELFEYRSPNQTDEEAKYIKNNYKQVTLPIFLDYQNTITRPFGDGNWSIHYNEKDENQKYKKDRLSFKEYIESQIPIYGSLEFFIKSIVPSTKTIDANGFIAVRPKEIEYTQDLETNEFVVDSQILVKPTLFYFDSPSVIDYEEEQWYLFRSGEHSVVTDGADKQSETGTVFELYTKQGIYFIIQTGKKQNNEFIIEPFFDTTELPVVQLRGIPTIKDESILWQSPFLYATDILDLVAVNSNWLQASINKCVFPNVVMFGSPCEFRDTEGNICNGGRIINGDGKETTCKQCGGSGLKSRLSPLGTMLLQPTTKFKDGEEKTTQDPLRFISPEVHTLEFQMKKIESDEMKAKAILHIRNKNSSAKSVGDVTATEIFDDAKGMTAFVKPISDQTFNIYEFCLNQIGLQRYGSEFKKPTLVYPKSFDFKTPEDYLKDLTDGIKNNLHPALIQLIIMQYVSAYYSDSVSTTKMFTLISYADRLFGLGQDEVNMKLAKGTCAKWEDILHTSILYFISELEREDPKFLEKDLTTQIEMLVEKAKEAELEINPVSNMYNDLLPPNPIPEPVPPVN